MMKKRYMMLFVAQLFSYHTQTMENQGNSPTPLSHYYVISRQCQVCQEKFSESYFLFDLQSDPIRHICKDPYFSEKRETKKRSKIIQNKEKFRFNKRNAKEDDLVSQFQKRLKIDVNPQGDLHR